MRGKSDEDGRDKERIGGNKERRKGGSIRMSRGKSGHIKDGSDVLEEGRNSKRQSSKKEMSEISSEESE